MVFPDTDGAEVQAVGKPFVSSALVEILFTKTVSSFQEKSNSIHNGRPRRVGLSAGITLVPLGKQMVQNS